jgi:hypothetical protein
MFASLLVMDRSGAGEILSAVINCVGETPECRSLGGPARSLQAWIPRLAAGIGRRFRC